MTRGEGENDLKKPNRLSIIYCRRNMELKLKSSILIGKWSMSYREKVAIGQRFGLKNKINMYLCFRHNKIKAAQSKSFYFVNGPKFSTDMLRIWISKQIMVFSCDIGFKG